jgi:hypothetical protein
MNNPPEGMGTLKHTPGPWRADKCRYGFAVYAYKSCDVVVRTEDYEGRYGAIDNEANARLIAAAPELLEVAQRSADALRSAGIEPRATSDNPLEWLLHQTEAAIAKATQEPQE